MDVSRQRSLLPHYLALLVLVVAAVGGVRLTIGRVGPLVNMGVVVVIVLAYPSAVRLLDLAPAAWER